MAIGVASAIGLALSVVDVALSIAPDQDMRELQDKLDELDAELDELGETLLQELNIVSDQQIASANALATSAGDMLARWRRQEEPSAQLTADTISTAQEALNEVIALVEVALDGADPAQALGYIGAITYALNVRVQVANELEGGALGTNAIARSFADAADIFEEIHDLMPGVIEEQVSHSSSSAVSYSGTDYFLGVPTAMNVTITQTVTVRSDLTGETETRSFSWSDKITALDFALIFTPILGNPLDLIQTALGQIPMPSSTSSSISSFISQSTDDIVDHDMAHFGFDELPQIAAGYDDLSDGEEVVGSNGNDGALRGTAGIDLIVGKGGDDWMRGLEDHDVLRGGSGDDNMHGGGGNDRVEGDDGRDRIKGGGGEDLLDGGEGNDRLFGDGSADILIGGDGADRLYGGANRDELIGGKGQDLLEGGDGKDILEGGQGHDEFVLDGRHADVIRDFGLGNDTITLDKDFFNGLGRGQLDEDNFTLRGEPLGTGPQVIFDGDSLFFDADGRGSGAAVKIAELEGAPELDHTDIFIM